jgi:Protein of unknown function (DUF2846)
MRSALVVMLLAASSFAQDKSALVAACGPRSTNFDVKREASQHALAQPERGKALVYFVQDMGVMTCLGACLTTKIGLDGTWVGAEENNSYFSVSVEPGEHHVCANRQSRFARANRMLALAHFTAEAGNVYYFRARTFGEKTEVFLDLDRVDSDQGEYLVASYPMSVFHAKP